LKKRSTDTLNNCPNNRERRD